MIGVVSDMHLKESLGYADYISDRRQSERQEVLDAVEKVFENCDMVVMLGDMLNSRNNPSAVLREFTQFIERFDGKEVVVVAGNHEKRADGTTAIDFLKEIKKPKWTVVTTEPKLLTRKFGERSRKLLFMPYFHKAEVGVASSEALTKKLLDKYVPDKQLDMLFVHHAISDTKTEFGQSTNMFHEHVFPKAELEKSFKLVIGGHIHHPQKSGNTYVVGSTFSNEIGEGQRSVLLINEQTMGVKRIKLPGRHLVKLQDPTEQELDSAKKKGVIAKVILTKKKTKTYVDGLKELLRDFDAYILVERYPKERKKVHFEEGMLEFSPDKLLKQYAKERGVNYKKLLEAWELIK